MILIAGPCVIESREQIMRIAESLSYANEKYEFTSKQVMIKQIELV
jgi:2-dehydro-3-deoxyphosphooctonate aldolase (KDO 8-P synthase)